MRTSRYASPVLGHKQDRNLWSRILGRSPKDPGASPGFPVFIHKGTFTLQRKIIMTLGKLLQQVALQGLIRWLGIAGNAQRAEVVAANIIEMFVASQEAAAAAAAAV